MLGEVQPHPKVHRHLPIFAEGRILADFLVAGIVFSPALTNLMSLEEQVCLFISSFLLMI